MSSSFFCAVSGGDRKDLVGVNTKAQSQPHNSFNGDVYRRPFDDLADVAAGDPPARPARKLTKGEAFLLSHALDVLAQSLFHSELYFLLNAFLYHELKVRSIAKVGAA
jgi:hypothetical protein